jgi:hypothetical protein
MAPSSRVAGRLSGSFHVLFSVIAAAAAVLSFAVLAQYFPKEVSSRRANWGLT